MTSGKIIETPNLLFLGAGASKPYGRMLMGEFVRSFRQGGHPGSAKEKTSGPRGILIPTRF